MSISLSSPQPSYSFSWLDLLFQGVQVLQLSNLSDAQEVKLGRQINRQLLQQGKVRLIRNPALNQYLNQIGQRLASTSDRPNIPYTFVIVNDRDINAFATMGGFVYINVGTITAADDEAELASVLAHEIGHIAGRHALEQMKNAAISQGLLSAAGLNESTIVQLGVQLAVDLPNSREAEFDADRRGLLNLQRAGYAPVGAINFLQKLMRQGNSVPTLLNTHPATTDRLAALEQEINPQTANLGDGLDKQAYHRQIRTLLSRKTVGINLNRGSDKMTAIATLQIPSSIL
jgi:predicted Zn-dependent protease